MSKVVDDFTFVKYQRQESVNQSEDEWNEAPRLPIPEERYVELSCTKDYFRGTHYRVTEKAFEKEARRQDVNECDGVPSGMLASRWLGAVSTLL